MNKIWFIFFLILYNCNPNTENFKVIADLSKSLKEVSGMEKTSKSEMIWMVNDAGNSPKLFGVNSKGKIKKVLNINAKNNDWEDLTSDPQGNLYIGDFGNNLSNRTNLAVLKVKQSDLKSDSLVNIERISFRYPSQIKIPSKKKNRYFDCEAFFFFNDSLFLFTKSRVKTDFGTTSLYKIPAKQGQHIAEYVDSFTSCPKMKCWITSADISDDGKTAALLSPKSVWLFTNFSSGNFLNGNTKEIPLRHNSQLESIFFKDKETLYLSDEKAHGEGGNLYALKLD
ncbi:hypothetical protein A9Q87_02600 [Flavobacteriales bacterium 34_180_T64]|nr:hypothetical protein A9Q87_02600 [Flavobacteriales bacterium 34_180_T64]